MRLLVLALALSAALDAGGAHAFALLGTKWDPGPNAASSFAVAPGIPGSASWSIMTANLGLDPAIQTAVSPLWDPDHSGPTTSLDTFLGNPNSNSEEVAIINAALNVWDAVSGFTSLGMVSDGGASAGAPMPQGGHVGDIRIGAFPFVFGVLGGTFRPGTELMSLGLAEGQGGTVGGDVHMNNAVFWADDATDLFSDPDVDFYSIMLHELGHALGIGHSAVTSAVMYPSYSGARRTLDADDIAAIQAIYGSSVVPEPGTFALLALGVLVALALSKSKGPAAVRPKAPGRIIVGVQHGSIHRDAKAPLSRRPARCRLLESARPRDGVCA
jgi:hypothetical protein